jgi:4-hydroxybenzoate polyprenyltransferase
MWGIWSFTLVVGLSLLFKIPSPTLVAGSILALFVAMYFFSLKLLEDGEIYHKEFSAAIIYSTGIFIGPVSIYNGDLSSDIWILFIEYALLAAINLLLFSMYEQLTNEKSGFQSLLKTVGSKKVGAISLILLSAVVILSMAFSILFWESPQILKAQLIILFMAICLILVIVNKNTLIINDRYRTVGDAIFYIPILYFLF